MTPSEVHARLVELWTAGRFEEGLSFIDADVVDHRGGTAGDHRGIDAWRAKWEQMADVAVKVEQNVSEGEFSVNRYSSSGPGYVVTGMDMIRVRDDRIVEHWALMDVTARAAQLSAGQAGT
ncbi:nuclear transport factor 2 family protein [Amycolatopsis sp. cmx-4-61]|uniref:nuclear transport factor 2 family protein n=1 Tax=Amycolatopsis sp. cmx-4-61 TaxID=2790937 RepID=UPI00397C3516